MEGVPHLTTYKGAIPLGRATPDELQAQIRRVAGSPIVRALLEALDGGILVLNSHRQIVAANLRNVVDLPDEAAARALGLRPGEALGCVHATGRPGGCGASDACRGCGALKTILGCQNGRAPVEGECLVTATNGVVHPLELKLRATPFTIEGQTFVVLALRDASDEKRRSILEQVFFHDLLNLMTPLSTWAQMLRSIPPEQFKEAGDRVAHLVDRVVAEIDAQRALLRAEQGTLQLTVRPTSADEILAEVESAFQGHSLARARSLTVERIGASLSVDTDRALLLRILTNMVTNALEATPEGGRVRTWCDRPDSGRWTCAFHVQNEAVMPREVAVHMFRRSFSTKAIKGRGLGTYSMKLLGERYLGGEVSFLSQAGWGTVFTFKLPARPDPPPATKPPERCF